MQDAVGWFSSFILLLTLIAQIREEVRTGAAGVSIWLFVGQMTAQIGFVIYSCLVGNVVFIVTNSLLLLVSVIGLVVTRRAKAA